MFNSSLRAHLRGSALVLFAALVSSLAGCSLETPSPTPSQLTSTRASPSATATPSVAWTATATATWSPVPTETPLPPTLTPTPTPSISVAEHMAAAAALRRAGEYERAVAEYAAVISSVPPDDLTAEALFQLGDVYFVQEDYRMAIDVLGHFERGYPDAPQLPAVLSRLALAHRQRGEWDLALQYYQRHAASAGQAPGAILAQIGEAYDHLGQGEQAAQAYEQALQADLAPSLRRQVGEELALLYRRAGQLDQAVEHYQRVSELTTSATYKARLLYEIGETYRAAALFEKAAPYYQQAIDLYPEDNSAYLSLVALLDMDVEVDPLQRGIIDYHAGQYPVAAEVLEGYIQDDPKADAPQAYLYIALAQREQEEWAAALAALEAITRKYPKSGLVPSALYQQARVLQLSGEQERAVAAYTRLVAQHPKDALADDALWQKAQLLEELERATQAAAAYGELVASHPASSYADRARLRAGMLHYEAGAFKAAAAAWEKALEAELADGTRARLTFWAGKAREAQGDHALALARWQEVAEMDPDAYYALRARELAEGAPIESAPADRNEALYDLSAYQMITTTWTAGCDPSCQWAQNLSASLGLAETPEQAREAVRSAEALVQGKALLAAGDRDNALRQLEYAQEQVADRPLALYALALELRELGQYRRASACADRLISLAKGTSLRDVPAPLLQISYPTYYIELIAPAASAYNIDPRLFLALVRQESRFDARATSWAGARGLSQIMPTTGEWIALRLGDSGFSRQELYRPTLNVSYGLWYLAQGLDMFERHILAALAGYNGGPGNVSRWAGGLPIQDVDLFVENIGAAETRTYVATIWEQYNVYRWLYPVPKPASP